MLEQRDHRGKRFVIDDVGGVDAPVERQCSDDAIEKQIQRKLRELERAKAVAGPAGEHPDVEVLER